MIPSTLPRSRALTGSLARFVLTSMAVSTLACGGSAPAPKGVERESPPKAESSEYSDRESRPSGPDCSDGTCFRCGEALCLPGFFCDESSAVANCQWLAKCGKAGGCGCIQQVLGTSCTCTERDGGTFVKCPA